MNNPMMNDFTRRDFLKVTTASAGVVAMSQATMPTVLGATAGSEKIRVGVIGCGGRGTGAARNCMDADPAVEIVALADLFPEQLEKARNSLANPAGGKKKDRQGDGPKRVAKISPDMCFSGFDCHEKLLKNAKVDMVILAAPPGFRPSHFAAAVAAGKHIFTEKPVAVDPAGCRAFIAAAKIAQQKKLSVVAGTQRRYDFAYKAVMQRIHEGAIGELVAAQCYWNGGGIWFREKKDWITKYSDLEWQCYNWYHYDWLCGDHIVEQHIHNIDVLNWAFKGTPVKFQGMGGRQNRGNISGNIWDHFAVEMDYANGARVSSMCRHAANTMSRVSERIVGTKGTSDPSKWIRDMQGKEIYSYTGERKDPYVLEHVELIKSIRGGNAINEGQQVAESTLTAIGGRMAAYTGREISWNWLMNASKLDIFPKQLQAGPALINPIPIPGTTELV